MFVHQKQAWFDFKWDSDKIVSHCLEMFGIYRENYWDKWKASAFH